MKNSENISVIILFKKKTSTQKEVQKTRLMQKTTEKYLEKFQKTQINGEIDHDH